MTNSAEKQRFLVSFMVDARGGAMRGCRHSGVRVIIPPRKAAAPTRITCRYLRKDRLTYAPPLMEGEALASRILECGPTGAKFLGPVILEVPHFASLRGREREIIILRSDNGETWREHTLEATEDAVQDVLNESFDGEELRQLEDLNTSRITRILTTDFPQYFAIITRVRQEINAMGPDGGTVTSTVVPQVQAMFQPGALTKKIRVGLQAQPVDPALTAKLLGNSVAVSAIVTVEPRRRKFHKPITLTVPLPQAANKGMINQYSGEDPTLRLLCSITGGTTRAQWEDVTGSTPLTYMNDCVSFTTTVSARFWLIHCTNIADATKMATELYREVISVPYMAKFMVFAKRHLAEEARLRVFCMTDDREDKTLECQEHFEEVAKSRDVEVLEGKTQHLEFAGNLVPVTKSGEQLAFNFYAFRENRLPFIVRVKDPHAETVGRIAFMRQKKLSRADPPQSPICNLNISLPETITPELTPSQPDLLALDKYNLLSLSQPDSIHKADLHLSDIANMLGSDWLPLARQLHVADSDVAIIEAEYERNLPQQALVMLRLWVQTAEHKATGNTLEAALRSAGRSDIVARCMSNLEPVTDLGERRRAREICDTTKDAHSGHHDDNQQSYPDQKKSLSGNVSPTYEREERKYAAEEKAVTDEHSQKSQLSEKDVLEFMKDTEGDFDDNFRGVVKDFRQRSREEEVYAAEHNVEEACVKSRKDNSKEEPASTHVKEGGSHSIVTTKVTERKSFILDDDTVQEKIVVEKRVDHVVSPSDPIAKSEMLQKLGQELGEFDERVNEKHQAKLHMEHHSATEADADEEGSSRNSVVEDNMTIEVRGKNTNVTSYQIVGSDLEPNAASEVPSSVEVVSNEQQNQSESMMAHVDIKESQTKQEKDLVAKDVPYNEKPGSLPVESSEVLEQEAAGSVEYELSNDESIPEPCDKPASEPTCSPKQETDQHVVELPPSTPDSVSVEVAEEYAQIVEESVNLLTESSDSVIEDSLRNLGHKDEATSPEVPEIINSRPIESLISETAQTVSDDTKSIPVKSDTQSQIIPDLTEVAVTEYPETKSYDIEGSDGLGASKPDEGEIFTDIQLEKAASQSPSESKTVEEEIGYPVHGETVLDTEVDCDEPFQATKESKVERDVYSESVIEEHTKPVAEAIATDVNDAKPTVIETSTSLTEVSPDLSTEVIAVDAELCQQINTDEELMTVTEVVSKTENDGVQSEPEKPPVHDGKNVSDSTELEMCEQDKFEAKVSIDVDTALGKPAVEAVMSEVKEEIVSEEQQILEEKSSIDSDDRASVHETCEAVRRPPPGEPQRSTESSSGAGGSSSGDAVEDDFTLENPYAKFEGERGQDEVKTGVCGERQSSSEESSSSSDSSDDDDALASNAATSTSNVYVLDSHVDQPTSDVYVLDSHVDQPTSDVYVLDSHVAQPASNVGDLIYHSDYPVSNADASDSHVDQPTSNVNHPASNVDVLDSHIDHPASNVEVLDSYVDQTALNVDVLDSHVDVLVSDENAPPSTEKSRASAEDSITPLAETPDLNVSYTNAEQQNTDLQESVVQRKSFSSDGTSEEDDFVLVNPNTNEMIVDELKSDALSDIEVVVNTLEKEHALGDDLSHTDAHGLSRANVEYINEPNNRERDFNEPLENHSELSDAPTNNIDGGLIDDVNEMQKNSAWETTDEMNYIPSPIDKDCNLDKTIPTEDNVSLEPERAVISSNGLVPNDKALHEHPEFEGIANASEVNSDTNIISTDVNEGTKYEESTSPTEKSQSLSILPSSELLESTTGCEDWLGGEQGVVKNADNTSTQAATTPASKSDPENDLSIKSQ